VSYSTVEKIGDWEFNTDQWPGMWSGPTYRRKSPEEVEAETKVEVAKLVKARRLSRLESRWNAKQRRLENQ